MRLPLKPTRLKAKADWQARAVLASCVVVCGIATTWAQEAIVHYQSSRQAVVAPAATAPATQPTLRELYQTSPDRWPEATWDASIPVEQRHEIAAVPDVIYPESNPFSREKAELGRQLFWDPRLSSSNSVACVSCHHPDMAWADGKTVSQGHHLVPLDRNAPSLLGVGLMPKLMWDGRADSLEDQALLPIANEKEMHGAFDDIEKNLNAIEGYRAAFKRVFGEETITLDHVVKAIATFERTLVPGRSRLDAFLDGRYRALDDQQLRGLHLFRTKARCINCHNGPLLTDGQMHNVGLTYYGRRFEDLGQYHITKNAADVGKFRTPSLRNVSRTGPLMHNGLFELPGVINLYNSGMPNEKIKDPNDPLAPKKSQLLIPLNLTAAEKVDLIAFLTALEEPRTRIRTPVLPGMYGSSSGEATTQAVDEDDTKPE